MNRRSVTPILWLLALLVGGAFIAAVAYGAGAASAGTASAAAAPAWAYGWHWGFGLWFLFPILFFVLIALLFRAIFWGRGPGYGPRHWDGGSQGPWGSDSWAARRDAALDDWHRRAHGGSGEGPGTQSPPPNESQTPPFGGR